MTVRKGRIRTVTRGESGSLRYKKKKAAKVVNETMTSFATLQRFSLSTKCLSDIMVGL
ncbi:hypothetical protein ABN702_05490 [Bacillus haimaensis]|uniref:hypothetical protein n=1 Tax=Bacillus haimaensis TaxID=3160967 RepID=UPI003AA9D59F